MLLDTPWNAAEWTHDPRTQGGGRRPPSRCHARRRAGRARKALPPSTGERRAAEAGVTSGGLLVGTGRGLHIRHPERTGVVGSSETSGAVGVTLGRTARSGRSGGCGDGPPESGRGAEEQADAEGSSTRPWEDARWGHVLPAAAAGRKRPPRSPNRRHVRAARHPNHAPWRPPPPAQAARFGRKSILRAGPAALVDSSKKMGLLKVGKDVAMRKGKCHTGARSSSCNVVENEGRGTRRFGIVARQQLSKGTAPTLGEARLAVSVTPDGPLANQSAGCAKPHEYVRPWAQAP